MFAHFKLGRAPHDPDRIDQAPHLYGLRKPPLRLERDLTAFKVGMYDNDKLSDCTAVALANGARLFSWTQTQTDIIVDPVKVPQFFASANGVTDPAKVNGAVIQDMFEYQAKNGMDLGGQTPLVAKFAACHEFSTYALASIMALFGSVNLGVALSVADQTAKKWDTNYPALQGDPAPGSWGLHNLNGAAYDGLALDDIVWLATWGVWQPATWRWLLMSIDEAWALFWHQLMGPGTLAQWQSLVDESTRIV